MFYVVQTAPAKEQITKTFIDEMVGSKIKLKSYSLTRDMRKKFGGQWMTVKEKLFPGYIFVETEDILDTYLSSYAVPLLTKYIGREVDLFETLTEKESGWISKLVAEGEEVPVSEIDIAEGNKVTILSGPLTELEGYVKKVDLHRRQAEVEVDFMGRKTVFYLGIEFVKKM